MSFKFLYHSNDFCFFISRPHRFVKTLLLNFQYLQQVVHTHGFCTCFEFAWIRANPKYDNLELEEHEFIDIAINAGFLFDERVTKYSYTLGRHEGMVFIDKNIVDVMTEFFPDKYSSLFEYSKTPKAGRMYYALLGYLYPEVKYNFNARFQSCYEQALSIVMDEIQPYEVASLNEVIDEMPKSTSAGFVAIRTTGGRKKKEVILPTIIEEFKKMKKAAINNKDFENYIMFAMRGHLSKKTALKTRPIWMQSAETILAEKIFSRGLYKQFETNKFFKERMIHGSGALKHLRRYLSSESDLYFCNTDISGWDAYRAVFNHVRFYKELKTKIIMNEHDSKFFDFVCFKSNIYGRVIFPSGRSFKTNGGLKSGSDFTLAQNSCLNLINSITVLLMMGVDINYDIRKYSVLGDDFSLITRRKFDAIKFGDLLLKYFGLQVKEEKCYFAEPFQDRKFLGYQMRGGFLEKDKTELWAGVLYTEHYFKVNFDSIAKSFTRVFSYLILGGFSDYEFVEFFYLFLGKYGNWLDKVEYIFDDQSMRMTRVLKDIYNVKISKFNSETFKKFSLLAVKYILLYDYDLIRVNQELNYY